MPVTIKWNQTAFTEVIMTDGIQKSEAQMVSYARNAFDFHKNTFLRDFDNHRISKELTAGPDKDSSLFNWGSLFAFIGFNKKDDPIERLHIFFKNNFIPPQKSNNRAIVKRKNKQTAIFSVFGSRPDLKEIAQQTRRPWDNVGSWALELETGKLPHFDKFLPGHFEDVAASESGRGLEKKKPFRKDRYVKPAEGYLRVLLNEFDAKL